MASRDLNSTGMMLTSPNSASNIFNPDGPHPIRQKNAFVVRFLRNQAADEAEWREGLTFIVKNIDRPSVQPVVEEINQYNRKRLIHTGVKYSPINCTFYDTADGAAMNMWVEYARYYFGDYRLDPAAYSDDILNSQINQGPFLDNAGVTIQPESLAFNNGINSQFFFDKVIVYQVWGNEYTSFELVNPRINNFAPDELTYEDSAASTVQMTLQFEAINHGNRGRPQDLFSEASLEAIFSDGLYDGQTIEVEAPPKQNSFAGNFKKSQARDTLRTSIFSQAFADTKVERTTIDSGGGVLSRFGNYSFGDSLSGADGAQVADDRVFGAAIPAAISKTASFDQTDDAVYSAVGENALKITGLARALNVAASDLGGAPMDQVIREGGLQLSNRAVSAFNEQMDGTFLGGTKKSS